MTPNEIVEGIAAAIDRMNEGRAQRVTMVAVSLDTVGVLRTLSTGLEIYVGDARVLWDDDVSDDEVAALAIDGVRMPDWRERPRVRYRNGNQPLPPLPPLPSLEFTRDEALYGEFDPVAGF